MLRSGPLDGVARPRIAVVVAGGDLEAFLAARTLVLAVRRRVPRARLSVLGRAPSSPPSALDCGRPPGLLDAGDPAAADRLAGGFDLLLTLAGQDGGGGGGLKDSPGGPAVAGLGATALDIAGIAAAAQPDSLRLSRVALLRRLGWLPPTAGVAHVLVDADPTQLAEVAAALEGSTDTAIAVLTLGGEVDLGSRVAQDGGDGPGRWVIPGAAGIDEIVAAAASARAYVGGHAAVAAVAAGAGVPCGPATTLPAVWRAGAPGASDQPAPGAAGAGRPVDEALERRLDDAAASAIATWTARGRPGAGEDAGRRRRSGAALAFLEVELRGLEMEAAGLRARIATLEEERALLLNSRTWRYTSLARRAFHGARRRLRG